MKEYNTVIDCIKDFDTTTALKEIMIDGTLYNQTNLHEIRERLWS